MASKKKEETVDKKKTDAAKDAVKETEAAEKTTSKAKKTAEAKSTEVNKEKPKKTANAKSVGEKATKGRKRAEKVGIVFSDKMTKTVVVRVDRVVKHPLYHKYMKRRKKFVAHDEMGASTGDRVRIAETRPLSARKRWRVVEILQKAVK